MKSKTVEKTLGKLLIFCLLISLLILAPQKRAVLLCAVQNIDYAKYYFYTSVKVEQTENLNAEVLDNGIGSIVICSAVDSEKIKQKVENITGESITFYAEPSSVEKSLNLLNADVVTYEEIGNMRLIYAYTNKIGNYVRVNNQKVNLQLVYKSGIMIIGTPLILGSY